MPIKKVSGGYKWGKSGKIYPTKAGAQKQAQAAYASGYKNGGPVAGKYGGMKGIAGIAAMTPVGARGTSNRPGGRNTKMRGRMQAGVIEEKQTRADMNEIARLINPQTYMAQGMFPEEARAKAMEMKDMYGTPEEYRKYRYDKNFGMGSEYGTGEELRAAGIDAIPSAATSFGMPKNFIEEIMSYFEKTGTFAGAPAPSALADEVAKFIKNNPLGNRRLPPWLTGGGGG